MKRTLSLVAAAVMVMALSTPSEAGVARAVAKGAVKGVKGVVHVVVAGVKKLV